ncbi:MAG TPA: addiction module protein [Pyrinomonadaceae bacterium]|jgi:hypothetical protein
MSSEQLNEDNLDPDYVNNEYVSIPDWHMAILEERMARYKSEQVEWTPLEEFAKEIEQFRNSLKVKKD